MKRDRASQSQEILAVAAPWCDAPWGAIRGLKITKHDLSPATYFLKDAAQAKQLLGDGLSDEQSNPFARRKLKDGKPDRDSYHIGVVRIGGKGDDLMTAATLTALKRRFPQACITLFARDNTGQLQGHPAIDRLVFGGQTLWKEIVRDVRERYDAFIDMESYVPKVWVFRPEPDLQKWGMECKEKFLYDAPLEGVDGYAGFYYDFPFGLNKLNLLGKNLIRLTDELLGLEYRPEDLKMYLGPHDRDKAAIIKQIMGDYVVLHNGSACGRQTKNWATHNWTEVAKWLLDNDKVCVQIGTKNEDYIQGCVDLRGLTSVPEMAGVIEASKLLVDTEGGPAHIAAAVGTRAVVLFGPTLAKMFGNPNAVHIETDLPCAGCWYRTDKWHMICPEGYERALCMESIDAERVKAAIAAELGIDTTPKRVDVIVGDPGAKVAYLEKAATVAAVHVGGNGDATKEKPVLGDLAIAIPTRNRPEAIRKLLASIGQQTQRPGKVLIVDDGDKPLLSQHPLPEVIPGPQRGPHYAHQMALEHLTDYDYILRLDDDIVLESPDFIERIYRIISSDPQVGAVGGVYPQPEWANQSHDPAFIRNGGDYSTTIAGMLQGKNSAQFYRYTESAEVAAEHLYSSFVYRRKAAMDIGGFALCYSPRGHREETDFTFRLHLAGWKLCFDTGAMARHERCITGGLRDMADNVQLDQWRREDECLFLERFNSGKLEREAKGEAVTA